VSARFKTHPVRYVKPGRTFRLRLSLKEDEPLPEAVGMRLELPAGDLSVHKATLLNAAKGVSKAAKEGLVVVGGNGIVSITWSNLDDLFPSKGGWAAKALKFVVEAKVSSTVTKGDTLVANAYLTGGDICDVLLGSSNIVTVK
jgi:hypothetical protein